MALKMSRADHFESPVGQRASTQSLGQEMDTEARHGQFVGLRSLYLKASAFDNAYARRADSYALRDRWLQTAFTTLTAFTSASAFVSFTQSDPSNSVKLTVLILALVTAGYPPCVKACRGATSARHTGVRALNGRGSGIRPRIW